MNLRLLLVESEPEDVIFLKDVLIEIESGRYWSQWVHIETLHAATASDAVAIVSNEIVDVILLDLDLSDSQGTDTFREMQGIAEHIPMVLLMGSEEDALAVRMIRDGAQDFLLKKQIDCAPLAHAIRNAVERHRLLAAARAGAITDPLTGLPNRGGFLTFADRDRKLAERMGRRMMIAVAEPKDGADISTRDGRQRRDLIMVEAADHLRSLSGPTDFLARIGQNRFAMTIFDTDAESVEEAWARLHAGLAGHRIRIGAAIFDRDRPVSLDALLDQAALDLAPTALAMRR
jgi:PleD family two-component response regulator